MTETFGVAGRNMLSGADVRARREPALIDQLLEMVLAFEPLELKQTRSADVTAVVRPAERDCAPAPALVAESTQRMLAQMRTVLDREAARLSEDGAEGKAAVDQVALIARTLEKIDQMERLIAEDQARSMQRTLSPDEREQMRQTVRSLILAAAERLAVERAGEQSNADDAETAPE